MREVVNTLLYLNRSGCQWDMLPHDLLAKSTVYDYFAQWRDDQDAGGSTGASPEGSRA
jgi:putative transposase